MKQDLNENSYKVYVIGDKAASSENSSNSLANINTERIDASDKYDRNINIVNRFKEQLL